MSEAVGLEGSEAALLADPDIQWSFGVALYEGADGQVANAETAPAYAAAIDDPAFPVLADLDGVLIDSTPWNGSGMPAWCVLSPQMTLLDCFGGIDDDRLADAVTTHHATR